MRRTVIVLVGVGAIVITAWASYTVYQSVRMDPAEVVDQPTDSASVLGSEVDVIASATRDADSLRVFGRVLERGQFVEGARVWLVAEDGSGQRISPSGVETNPAGEFSLPAVPVQVGAQTLDGQLDLTVFARPAGDSVSTVQTEISVNAFRRVSEQRLSMPALLLIAVLFVASIALALVDAPGDRLVNTLKYYLSVLLAFLLTGAMIVSIALGIRRVPLVAEVTDVLSLGFGRVYMGTYVDGVQPEWVFSFTSPASEFSLNTVDSGFGAPLWVILLSAVGAGLFTTSLIVRQVQDPIGQDPTMMAPTGGEGPDPTVVALDLRDRVGEVVQHQFYILFAPLGGVVVYQLQVAAGAASNQVVVGVAALAAGLAVNLVLERALRQVTELVKVARGQPQPGSHQAAGTDSTTEAQREAM